MKPRRTLGKSALAVLTLLGLGGGGTAIAVEKDTIVGPIETELGTPTRKSAQKLYDELDYTSAVNAYVWGMPAVNIAGYFVTWEDFFKADWGQFVALPTTQDRRGCLTPTTTSTYIFAMADLSETGPLVMEDPAGNAVGIIIDLWQRLLAEVGTAGPFKGKGGEFLILGPGQQQPEDAAVFHVVRSPGPPHEPWARGRIA